ncbi:hemolysin III family protein, partial [Yersinia pestis]
MKNKSGTQPLFATPSVPAAQTATPTPAYPWAEELANSLSHGIGVVFGIVGLV